MRKLAVVAVVLLIGILAGIALQPDDGTALSRPEGVGAKIDGANHAKPLPRVPSVAEIVSSLAAVVLGLLLLLQQLMWVPDLRRERSGCRRRERLGVRDLSRRGPPLAV